MQHHRHVIVLERCAQLLQRLRCPLGIGACILADQFQIETADQVAEVIAETHHTEVVHIGQPRFAVGAQLEQTLFERCQVGVDLRLGLGGQAHQVRRHHIGHAPHVIAGEPRLTVQPVDLVVGLYGYAGQGAVHGASGVDFDDADIAAPGDRVQRVIRPQ
ncbi:hypothetical protein D3C73_925690 [compost metagenome]